MPDPRTNKGGRIARASVVDYLDRQLEIQQLNGNHGVAQFIVKMKRWLRDAARRNRRPGGLGRR